MVNINETKRLVQEMNSLAHRTNLSLLASDARVLRFYARDGGRLLGIPEYYQVKESFRKRYFLLFGNKVMGFSKSYWDTGMDGRR